MLAFHILSIPLIFEYVLGNSIICSVDNRHMSDPISRAPEYYDGTFDYLKSLGIPLLN
jgi:hypothetical protein